MLQGTIGRAFGQAYENCRLNTQVIAAPGSNQPCSAANLQGYNTAQTATGAPACAIGVSNGSGAGHRGAERLGRSGTPGINSKGTVISSGQAGTLFTPGELVAYPQGMEPQEGIREVDYQYNTGLKFKLAGFRLRRQHRLRQGNRQNLHPTIPPTARLFIDTHYDTVQFL